MQPLLLALSTILAVIAPITYIISIVQGRSKPHRMTRFILFFVLTLNFVSILAAHGNTGAMVFAGITFVQATIIFFMSLWRGMGGSSKFDWICLGIAAVGIIGWKITGNPVLGIWFSILADLSAYLPAFVKTWKHPYTESPWFYVFGVVSALLGLIAYKIDASSIFQIYIILGSLTMLACIYHTGFHQVKKKAKRQVKYI